MRMAPKRQLKLVAPSEEEDSSSSEPIAEEKLEGSDNTESESGSESESASDTLSKPGPEAQKTKTQNTQMPTPSKPSLKRRPTEPKDSKEPDGKKKKKKKKKSSQMHTVELEEKKNEGSEDVGAIASEKKTIIQRIWSDEDEIALLRGMIDFAEAKGDDPSNHMGEFYEFVKKYIKMEASKGQVANKIRVFKNKFKNNEKKEKNGQDNILKGPRDQKAFKLMKMLWSKRIVRHDDPSKSLVERGNADLPMNVGSALEESVCVIETTRLFPNCVGAVFLKGLELIEGKKRAELDKRWTRLRVAEIKIDEERAALFQEQCRLVIEALDFED